jgi:ABC-type dipeptide/oligopeptide/nickel transport system permease subunit
MAEAVIAPAVVPRRRRAQLRIPPVSALLLLVIVALCVCAPLVVSTGPDQIDPTHPFAAASGQHWLGTDEVGRDLLSRLLYGGRLSLMVCAGSVAIAFVLGTIWGVAAADRGGWVDEILMRTADIAMAIPQILFALVCVAAFGASLLSLTLITGILLTPSSARMARSVTIQETALDYYSASIAYGAGKIRLLSTEVLPNILPALASQAAINAASAIILEASLSFVGLGVQPPQTSWGVLLQEGYGYLYNDPTYALSPAVMILLTVLCLNLVANKLSDPRTRRAARSSRKAARK